MARREDQRRGTEACVTFLRRRHPAAEVVKRRDRVLDAIALFRLAKAAGLILIGLGTLELLRPDVAVHVDDWLRSLPFAIHPPRLTRGHIKVAAAAAFAYAALFTTEGIGLWLQKRWAEYLTIVATSSLIPFEVWELVNKLTILRAALVIANAAIVIYLLIKVRRR